MALLYFEWHYWEKALELCAVLAVAGAAGALTSRGVRD